VTEQYTVKEFNEDKEQIRKAFEAGKRKIILRNVELKLSLQVHNVTWQTGVPRDRNKLTNEIKQHKQREEWIIAKPVDKNRFVPVFSIERKNNMRSAQSDIPKT
jgi:hypothetical protein